MMKLIRLFTAIAAILALCCVNVAAAGINILQSDSTVTISGVADNSEFVTLQVLKPGTQTEDVNSLKMTDMFYIKQATADWKGNFSFDVDVKPGITYPAIVSSGDSYEIIDIETIKLGVTTDKVGNIFKDYTNIEYTLEVDGLAANSQGYTVTEKVISEMSGAVVYTHNYEVTAAEEGMNKHTASINLSSSAQKYGTFKLEIIVTDTMQGQATVKTAFSVIHTSDNVEPNRLLGTGLTFNNRNETWETKEEIVQLFYDAGYSKNRSQILWHEYEQTKDNFVMRQYWKDSLDIQKTAGFEDPIYIYGYGNQWLGVSDPPITETELEAYGNYVYNLTKDLKEYTNTFEVWNEVNWRANYYPALTPQVYFNILKASAENAVRANENAKLYISLGAMVYNTNENYDIYNWLRQLLDMGAADYIEGVSLHVYTGIRMPEYDVSKTEVVENLKHILSDYGYANMPIILSETGYSSDDKDFTEWEQAMYSLRDFAMLYDAGLEAIHFYNGIEKQDGDPEQDNFGHINTWTEDYEYNASGVAYSAKPVFAAFANFNTLLSNAQLVSKTEENAGNYDYRFKAADGARVHMIWNSLDQASSYTLSTDSKMAIVYDMFGNSSIMTSDDGNYTVNVSGAPCYVVVPQNTLYSAADVYGNHLDRINTDTVYVSADSNALPETAKIAVAVYNDGLLVDCRVLSASEIGTAGIAVNTAGADEFAIFTFKDLGAITPLTNKFSLFRQEKANKK